MDIATDNTISKLIEELVKYGMDVTSLELEKGRLVYEGLCGAAKVAFLNVIEGILVISIEDIANYCPDLEPETLYESGLHFDSVEDLIWFEHDAIEPDGLEF